jgi:uncharacterized membrane protein (UPF0127 family)
MGPRETLAIAVILVLTGAAVIVTPLVTGPDEAGPERTSVTIESENGTRLAVVDARVADTQEERYTGLSDTESLGPDEGMLFVHRRDRQATYVMRDMAFQIDIVFIAPDGAIRTIHHTAASDAYEFPGRGKWVLELPANYTTAHDIGVGDRVVTEGLPTDAR